MRPIQSQPAPSSPPIDAPCTQCLRHGDPIRARKGLTNAVAVAALGAALGADALGLVDGGALGVADRGHCLADTLGVDVDAPEGPQEAGDRKERVTFRLPWALRLNIS